MLNALGKSWCTRDESGVKMRVAHRDPMVVSNVRSSVAGMGDIKLPAKIFCVNKPN